MAVATAIAASLTGALFAADAKVDKKKSQAAYERGLADDKQGQRADAIAAYSEALQLDPSSAAAYRARAGDYSAQGERDKASAD